MSWNVQLCVLRYTPHLIHYNIAMIVPITKVPNPILFQKAESVKKFDAKLKKLIQDMGDTLKAARDPEGVGLAAPQVGISLRLFVTRPTKQSKIRVYINPEITKIMEVKNEEGEKKNTSTLEGCLSVNRIWSEIERPLKVQMHYVDADNKPHSEWFEGFKATIMQHEIDHLNGTLFTNRALEQNSTVFEERNGKLEEIRI